MLKLNISKKGRCGRMSVKYPNVLKRIEELEKATYFHDDNAQDVYDNIMEVARAARPEAEHIECEIILETLYLLQKVHYEDLEMTTDENDKLFEVVV
jgi:hypothetical protein